MAIYDAGIASLAADGTVTGVGTTWRQPLTLIRVGATMIFNTTPASIVTIAEIISDTEIRVFNDKGFTAPTGTQYSILAHDGITVQGLAQDVAETLRYYQSRETEVAAAVDAFNQFDADAFHQNVTNVNNQSQQVSNDAAQVAADRASSELSASSALSSSNSAASYASDAELAAGSVSGALIGSFQDGITLNSKTQQILNINSGYVESYVWRGSFPKVVPEASTPDSTGGVSDSAWMRVDFGLLSVGGLGLLGSGLYSDIRSYTGESKFILCRGIYNDFDGAEGVFYRDDNDLASIDNSGTVLVDSIGRRWKRSFNGDVNVRWFTGNVGPEVDAAIGVQRCVNAYPYSRIIFPRVEGSGYYFKSMVVEPTSASYQLIGDDGIQVNNQTLIYVDYSGPAFYCAAENTTFTKYQGFRFETNKGSYIGGRAVLNEGFWVHGEFKNITCKYFNQVPLEVNGYNVCNFEQLTFQFCEQWGLLAKAGASNTFDRIIGDNNNGPVMSVTGASNAFRTLYSEDCCKRNVSEGESFPEFLISGDTPVITGISFNSYAGNSTPPLRFNFARNAVVIGASNKSTVSPSYAYEIDLTNQDSSVTIMNSSAIRFKPGSDSSNVIQIDAGYSTGSRPRILIGGFGRDLIANSPICTASFDGVSGGIFQANGLASIDKIGTGTYRINLAETVKYTQGVRVFGGANSDGLGNHVTISEQVSQRTSTSVVIVASNDSGAAVDPYQVSVSILGSV